MYLLSFYVTEAFLETVKMAVFAAGGGRIGNYDCCAWQVKGEGQFRPLSGSQPFIGAVGEIEKVVEYKVEMVVNATCLANCIRALKASHPYETPAYHVLRMES
ncbi:MAG: NGG1p interacting factor NIF3 [Hahellaceae bacterium]|nr:NGG1p interacting factor NIF3 [Hahellaceae bacterium]